MHHNILFKQNFKKEKPILGYFHDSIFQGLKCLIDRRVILLKNGCHAPHCRLPAP